MVQHVRYQFEPIELPRYVKSHPISDIGQCIACRAACTAKAHLVAKVSAASRSAGWGKGDRTCTIQKWLKAMSHAAKHCKSETFSHVRPRHCSSTPGKTSSDIDHLTGSIQRLYVRCVHLYFRHVQMKGWIMRSTCCINSNIKATPYRIESRHLQSKRNVKLCRQITNNTSQIRCHWADMSSNLFVFHCASFKAFNTLHGSIQLSKLQDLSIYPASSAGAAAGWWELGAASSSSNSLLIWSSRSRQWKKLVSIFWPSLLEIKLGFQHQLKRVHQTSIYMANFFPTYSFLQYKARIS